MDLPKATMKGPEPLKHTLHLVGQLLQQQQVQVAHQIALKKK